jgi:signal peptidase II
MSIARRVAWIVCVLLCCGGCDRVAKSYAQSHLGDQAVRSYLADTVRVQLRYNEGAFLSLGASLPKPWREALLRAGVAGVLLGLLLYAVFFAPPNPLLVAGASLVVAGGTSNLVDRFLYDGRVVDFVSVGIGPLRTGVFNLADAAITASVVLMFLSEFMQRRGRRT